MTEETDTTPASETDAPVNAEGAEPTASRDSAPSAEPTVKEEIESEAETTPVDQAAQPAPQADDEAPAAESATEHVPAEAEPAEAAHAEEKAEAVSQAESEGAEAVRAEAEADAEAEPREEASEATHSVEGEDPRPELRQLMELAVKHPEIGPPLAELAFKVGASDIAQRIVKMGLDDDQSVGVEFYAVAVDVARREGRYEDVFEQVQDALKTFAETTDADVTEDEANRLLHLVRNGFAVLLFDLEDVNAKPEWIATVSEQLPRLEERYASDPFYFSLLAQSQWFSDKEKSEATWEKAIEISDGDFAWNARGTWYKDAASDFEASQAAYRKGLEESPESALLLHNLAQLLTDEAEKQKEDSPDQARNWLNEADGLVRKALRQDTRRGLRRYIHGTKDRIRKMRNNLPEVEVDPPEKDAVVEGRIVAVVKYGAFVTVEGGRKGLMHISEFDHKHVKDPAEYVKVGDRIKVKVLSVEPQDDGTIRIGFSRKALLDPPKDADKSNNNQRRGSGKKSSKNRRNKKSRNQRPKGHREQPKKKDGMGTLGELLLQKLEEAKKSDD